MNENIIYIFLIIIFLFFLSNEVKINNFFSTKYFKILFILLIIYFVYEKYNFLYLMVLFLIIILLNIDFIKFKNNKYIKNFINLENFISDSKNIESRKDQKSILATFNINNLKKDILHEKEPFKDKVENIKELYDNIQNEIFKLKEIVT